MLRGERDDPLRRPAEPNPSPREEGALMTHRVSEKQDFSKVCKSASDCYSFQQLSLTYAISVYVLLRNSMFMFTCGIYGKVDRHISFSWWCDEKVVDFCFNSGRRKSRECLCIQPQVTPLTVSKIDMLLCFSCVESLEHMFVFLPCTILMNCVHLWKLRGP